MAMNKTVIIGGGIAGLATAFYLHEAGASFTLLECAPRFGGKIKSAEQDGFLIEGGPDSFITQKPATLELCRRLGLEEQFVGSSTGKGSTTYVWSGGRLHPMPEGMMLMAPTMVLPFLRSRLISWPGKLRMGMEFFLPRKRDGEDESLGAFVRRRLGHEALEKIAGPLMGGIHAADPDKLSLRSTFPMFLEMEQKHGSLLRAMMKRPKRKQAPGAKKLPMFMALRGGLEQLASALVAQLPADSLRSGCCVLSVRRESEQYRLALSDGTSMLADDVVFAAPAHVTAGLLQLLDPALADQLRGIPYVSTATVSLGFRSADIPNPLPGAGFIVPPTESRRITACSWSSQKFQHRAPHDSVLLRVFIGGAFAEHLAELDNEELVQLAREELQTIMGITAKPVLTSSYRWRKANPQYNVGHQQRVAAIERTLTKYPGLHLAGAAYRGSGIPDCIQSGIRAVAAIQERATRHHEELCI